MAVLGPSASVNMSGHLQSQLTKSLEKILEDAYLSGELKLSGRKLKDFPKNVQFNLSDTVIADLSKNRLCEVPGEVAGFTYLERLLLACNALRHVPDALGGLSSLTYLDLSSNQLSELPRDICRLPHLQVLLVCDNRLTSLPKELGSMRALAELDAARNRLQQLPMAVGDMAALKALHLQNNQLGLLPLQITYLRLEYLDISCNCISSLPLELRQMSSLVTLKLDNNPLVSPPTTVCMRGRLHIFKYLENLAHKDSTPAGHTRRHDDTRRSAKLHGGATVVLTSGHNTIDCLRHRTRHADSGYSTSDGGDKRWSNDGLPDDSGGGGGCGGGAVGGGSGRSTPSTPSTLSPSPAGTSRTHTLTLNSEGRPHTLSSNTPLRVSPDGPNITNGDDKGKVGQQTYRQYKEALRQQRQQDVYRPRTDPSSPSDCDSSNQSPVHTPRLSPQHSQSTPHSPVSNSRYVPPMTNAIYNKSLPNSGNSSPSGIPSSPLLHSTPRRNIPPASIPQTTLNYQNGSFNSTSETSMITQPPIKTEETAPKRPVQKVVPSRNTTNKSTVMNGNSTEHTRIPTSGTTKYTGIPQAENTYIKPLSPTKSPTGTLLHNSVPPNVRSNIPSRRDTSLGNGNGTLEGVNGAKLLTTTVTYLKGTSAKPAGGGAGAGGSGRLTWNKDLAPEKLSFTMKREFDKQKEETELLQELRVILESRLKMSLPTELSPVLADGVVLCHLANHVRPRAVASVHVPSPAQPKLTMARCRRNVDNFLEACRKIGVEEAEVCGAEDILQPGPDWAQAVLRTVLALLRLPPTTHHTLHRYNCYDQLPFVSNYNSNYFDETEEYHLTTQQDDSNIPSGTDLYEQQQLVPNFNTDYYFNEMEEYDALDSETNNGNQVILDNGGEWSVSTEGFKYRFVESNATYRSYETDNKINYVVPLVSNEYNHKLNRILEEDDMSSDVVDFAKAKFNLYEREKTNLDVEENFNEMQNTVPLLIEDENRQFVTSLCLGTFLLTVILLYLFPL